MERLADMIGGDSGWLSRLNLTTGSGGGVVSRMDPAMQALYFDRYARQDPFSRMRDRDQHARRAVPNILTDEDWIPKDRLVKTEFYNDFMRPIAAHSILMIPLSVRGVDEVCGININRVEQRGAFTFTDLETAERLQPHLSRAFELSRKLGEQLHLAEEVSGALDRVIHGIVLLDRGGRIRHANRAAEGLIGGSFGLRVFNGRLSALDPGAARRLQGLIDIASSPDRIGGRDGAMALPALAGRTPLSITVAPARAKKDSIFHGEAAVIVCISDPEAGASVSERRLRDLFGLTPAEGRVALALFDGCAPREAAERLGVSFQTVRNQMARVFEKTGVNRQSELTRLLSRLANLN